MWSFNIAALLFGEQLLLCTCTLICSLIGQVVLSYRWSMTQVCILFSFQVKFHMSKFIHLFTPPLDIQGGYTTVIYFLFKIGRAHV